MIKSDNTENSDILKEPASGLLDILGTQPPILSFSESSVLASLGNGTEFVETLPTSKAVSNHSEELQQSDSVTDIKTSGEVIKAAPEEVHSTPVGLLLELDEVVDLASQAVPNRNVTESLAPLETKVTTLLDSSFTEDVSTQPVLLTDIMQNGVFNPSKPDAMTDDELESYLAQLEKEEDQVDLIVSRIPAELELEINKPVKPNILETTPADELKLAEEPTGGDNLQEDLASISLPDVSDSDCDLNTTEELVQSEESEETSTLSEADTAEIHPEDSTGGDDDIPPLIDDPSLVPVDSISPSDPVVISSEPDVELPPSTVESSAIAFQLSEPVVQPSVATVPATVVEEQPIVASPVPEPAEEECYRNEEPPQDEEAHPILSAVPEEQQPSSTYGTQGEWHTSK